MSSREKKPVPGEPESGSQHSTLIRHPQFANGTWGAGDSAPPFGEEVQPDWDAVLANRDRNLAAVWVQLGNGWSSVAVIPAEPYDSTVEIGRALSEAGARISMYPVDFVDGTALDREGSARLFARLGMSARTGPRQERNGQDAEPAAWAPPIRRIVAALESPFANPLVLPVAHASDGVVLCVRRGSHRIASVRTTIEALGKTRIRSCVLLD